MNLKSSLAGYFRCGLTRISPKLNAKVLQRVKTGKKLNMQHPATLSEKLVVLKLEQYNRDPLVKLCADKYRVRSYVEQCGYGGLLNELAAAYDSVEDIQWDQLPEQFAMKWNFGCGYNIICADKTALDIPAAIKTLKEWQKKRKRAYLNYAELQYKDVPPKIIVEKFLKGLHSSRPNDYKVYCFHGKPAAILLIADRTQDIHPGGFFDPEWNYLGVPVIENRNSPGPFCAFEVMPERPRSLQTMLDASAKLSQGFPFVRCDFYDVDGQAVFGEMTFTPAGGHDVGQIDIHGVKMADMLKI